MSVRAKANVTSTDAAALMFGHGNAKRAAAIARPTTSSCILPGNDKSDSMVVSARRVARGVWGIDPPPQPPPQQGEAPSTSEVKAATHTCGTADIVQQHDLSATSGATEALVPCSKNGANDYSGAIRIETIPEGVHIAINATDDEVNAGMLGWT